MFYKLRFFKKTNGGICADDFKNTEQFVVINMNFILSLSDILNFTKPFSGDFVGKYAVVTMSNNDNYVINGTSFLEISEEIKNFNQKK